VGLPPASCSAARALCCGRGSPPPHRAQSEEYQELYECVDAGAFQDPSAWSREVCDQGSGAPRAPARGLGREIPRPGPRAIPRPAPRGGSRAGTCAASAYARAAPA
jgi:hypothetical protein